MPSRPPWRPLLLLLLSLWGPLLRRAETGSEGQTAGELYRRWERYRWECQETLEAAEPPAVAAGFVLRQCGSDGQWGPWRDHSQCENPDKNGTFQDQRRILERLQVVYTVGYSLSLATLLLALLILAFFRWDPRAVRGRGRDRASVWRARWGGQPPPATSSRPVVVLWEEGLGGGLRGSVWPRTGLQESPDCLPNPQAAALHSKLHPHQPVHLFHAAGGSHPHPRPAAASARPLPWGPDSRSVEPGYSHLQNGPDRDPVLRGRQLHVATGGGHLPAQPPGARGRPQGGPLPLLPASRLGCWERNEVKAIWWIIRTPILLAILINFFIFIRILGILVSKLRTRQMRYRDYRLRLARSMLTLVPLLGVHEVVFAPVTEEQARGHLRFAKLGFEIFLSSFQGLLVSFLYCFINKEVRLEIRRGWHRCRLRRTLGDGPRQPPERVSSTLPLGSGSRQMATGYTMSSGNLAGPGDEAGRALESYC
ncbi:gastric inhibitory polypeptide receptor isoform X2 [Sturnira hondurensis]|uniref:gastric inhibitory polypeptide receptor isoform X2 n=1 Tax=Sturnira hondurensis TaxID=192404 RepID=UPI00187AE465|nr:gastric inhibitory polypeptide receptor isoform X2 [Sturnira hondurensis]